MSKPKSKNDILVFRIGSIGDTVVSLPSLHMIRRRNPNHQITLLTNSPVDGGIKAAPSHQILMGSGLIDRYIEYPHGKFSVKSIIEVISTVRQLGPTQLFYLMPPRSLTQKARDLLLFRMAGISRINGLRFDTSVNTHKPVLRTRRYESEASRLLRSIGMDEIQLSQSLFNLGVSAGERAEAQKSLALLGEPNQFIALSVGAKVEAKDWGADNWAKLVEKMGARLGGYGLVFIGSQDEYERCRVLSSLWLGKTINLCGQLSPRESAAVLERAEIFIGHDSGPMHLASSVGTTCVSIFSARSKPGIWFPYGNEDNVIYNDVPCSNCGLNVCSKNEMICIRSISPDRVLALVLGLVQEQPNNMITQQ